MHVMPQAFPEVLLIEPKVFKDRRGHFLEIFQTRRYPEYGIPSTFIQDNVSFSLRGVIRGLHYQLHFPQGKLIVPLTGEIWDVEVDIRQGSPNFGKWLTVTLSGDSCRQLYVPPGGLQPSEMSWSS
jgi:dTDP-4-dehydrorhamnose 3,5-epimerase